MCHIVTQSKIVTVTLIKEQRFLQAAGCISEKWLSVELEVRMLFLISQNVLKLAVEKFRFEILLTTTGIRNHFKIIKSDRMIYSGVYQNVDATWNSDFEPSNGRLPSLTSFVWSIGFFKSSSHLYTSVTVKLDCTTTQSLGLNPCRSRASLFSEI